MFSVIARWRTGTALAALLFLSACGQYYEGEPSDHFDGVRFFNPEQEQKPSFAGFLRWQTSGKRKTWPEWVENEFRDRPPARIDNAELRVSFVNHATVLIQTAGLNILTDPVWSERIGPFNFVGPQRHRDPGIAFADLPKIDMVLLSHNHYDHLDLATIERLCTRDRPVMLVPLGNDAIIGGACGDGRVVAMDWNDSHFDRGLSYHLLPSLHWSSRGLTDRDKALWGAFLIETPDGNIYFAGDTGFGDGEIYRRVARDFGSVRLALLPIGAYRPRWFMIGHHMNPDDSVRAHKALGAAHSLAIHFGTFQLADEGIDDPLVDLDAARNRHGVDATSFRALENGQVWQIPGR